MEFVGKIRRRDMRLMFSSYSDNFEIFAIVDSWLLTHIHGQIFFEYGKSLLSYNHPEMIQTNELSHILNRYLLSIRMPKQQQFKMDNNNKHLTHKSNLIDKS